MAIRKDLLYVYKPFGPEFSCEMTFLDHDHANISIPGRSRIWQRNEYGDSGSRIQFSVKYLFRKHL